MTIYKWNELDIYIRLQICSCMARSPRLVPIRIASAPPPNMQ